MTDNLSWDIYPLPDDLPAPVIPDPSLPLVSIVTPSYYQGRFIRATIDSVLSQDYPNLEYWVIDGGSTDGTSGILREYERDPRFHWIGEPDRGQSDAINKGWRRCRGDVLAWLCSDDVYTPGAIRAQVAYLRANPDVEAVYSDAIVIDADGQPLRKDWARRFSLSDLLHLDFIPQSTVFLRRSLVEQTGPLDITLHYSMDYDYWLRASLRHTFAYAPAEIARYRLHPDSKSVSHINGFNGEMVRVIDRFFAQPDVPPALRRQRRAVDADLRLLIGINFARTNQVRQAVVSLGQALRRHPARPRTFWLLLRILEATGHFSVSDRLIERWHRFRSRV
jgi:glycosyltransferase involved in cell wall biosynthesis